MANICGSGLNQGGRKSLEKRRAPKSRRVIDTLLALRR